MSSSAAPTSLGQRVIKGAAWTIIAQIVVNLFRLGGNLVSARFLDSDAFGLMAIVGTVTIGLMMVSDVGIEHSVIYDSRADEPTFLRTAFSLQVLRGLLLWVGAVILTYPVVLFYDEPRFAGLLPVVCLQCFFAGFNSMKYAWNKRKVRRMRELALIEIGTQLAAFLLIVVLAWWLRSVWALAIGSATHALARMLLTHLLLDGPRDGFGWDRPCIDRIVRYGRWIFVSTFITFFSLRFDVFALGKLASISTLGLYNMALMLSSSINTIGFSVTQAVLFPALSEASRTGDPEVLRRTFERSRRVVLPVGLWAVTALVFLAPPFFHYAYRDQFEDAGWILQLQMSFVWFVFLTDAWVRGLMAVNDNRSMAIAHMIRFGAAIGLGLGGHALAGIPGFILGLGGASIMAHAWVHWALARHGLHALRLDIVYTLIGLPLVLFGAFGPDYIAKYTGTKPMEVAVILSLIVGIPFTLGLARFLRRNIQAARHAVDPGSPALSVSDEHASRA